MRTGIDLVLFVVWASVGLVALGVWFVATLRLSRKRTRKPDPVQPRTASAANTPVTVPV